MRGGAAKTIVQKWMMKQAAERTSISRDNFWEREEKIECVVCLATIWRFAGRAQSRMDGSMSPMCSFGH